MSVENWTALATIVIAVATVVYMVASIFQGRQMLKSFRLSLLQTLMNMATSKEADVVSAIMKHVFLHGYQEVFPKDYEKVNKAISKARDPKELNELLKAYQAQAIELDRLFQEGRQKLFSNRPDPFRRL